MQPLIRSKSAGVTGGRGTGGAGPGRDLQAPVFRPEHGLLSEAARRYLQRHEWEIYGRIHAKTKRRHQIPSNDGLEFF